MDTNCNWKQSIKYLHLVEQKYGSVNKTPKNDPNLLAIAELTKNQNTDDVDDLIKEAIEYGLSAGAIYQALNVKQRQVQNVKDFCHLRYKPLFKYKIIKNGRKDRYSPYIKGIARMLHFNKDGSKEQVIARANDRGYTVKPVTLYWGDLPDNCLYVIRNSPVYIKYGPDSWLKNTFHSTRLE